MNSHASTTEKLCLRAPLVAYVDGELTPSEELELEMHLAICPSCAAELNEQKKLLRALDFALEDKKEILLPANFTQIIVANAQSNVSGLRSPRERFKAFLVCSALLFLGLLGFNGESATVFNTFLKTADQFAAVFSFIFHLIYDISIGTAVILRSLGNQFVGNSAIAPAFLAAFFFVSLLAISRLFIRYQRA